MELVGYLDNFFFEIKHYYFTILELNKKFNIKIFIILYNKKLKYIIWVITDIYNIGINILDTISIIW